MTRKLLASLFVSVFSLSVAALAEESRPPADPNTGGTAKGAVVGGVAGAAVGHPVAGAAVGGVIGHHKRAKARKEAKKQQEAAASGQG